MTKPYALMAILFVLALFGSAGCARGKDWVVYEGKKAPGKHIVLLSGDDE